jgi:hypothetical protein
MCTFQQQIKQRIFSLIVVNLSKGYFNKYAILINKKKASFLKIKPKRKKRLHLKQLSKQLVNMGAVTFNLFIQSLSIARNQL